MPQAIHTQKNNPVGHQQRSKKPENRLLNNAPETSNGIELAIRQPRLANAENILKLQKTAGNQAVQRLFSGSVQREPTDEQGRLDSSISQAILSERGAGQGLPTEIRANMEAQLGHDLGHVHIHVGPKADQLSRQIHARAFTIGSDIFFRQDAYRPHTPRGQQTLAHELTHVVQQSGSSIHGPLVLGKRNDALEQQAHQFSMNVSHPSALSPAQPAIQAAQATASVQRDDDDPTAVLPSPKPTTAAPKPPAPPLPPRPVAPTSSGPTLPSPKPTAPAPRPPVPPPLPPRPVAPTSSGPTLPSPKPTVPAPRPPAPTTPPPSPAITPPIAPRKRRRMKGMVDTVSDVLDNDFIGETVGVTDPTMNGIANPFLEEGSKAATQAGYASGAWSAIKSPLDLVGIGGGLFNTFYQGRRHGKMETQKKYAAAELAHKEQKSAIKKAGVSSLSLAGNVSGAVGGFGIDMAGKVSGGFGVGLSAIDMARNTYGASRAFWKGHKLNQTRDKIEAYRTGINATTNPDEAKSAGELSEAARYMRNKKRHSGALKTIGAVAAGLGVAGGIASLVGGGIGTPLGFGLMTAGAGIGAAVGAYKLGRGIYKRAHRRNKLSKAEQELGITRPKAVGVKGHLSSAWNWLRGKDIENRQKEVEKKLDDKESAATTQTEKDTAADLRKRHYAAYKTQKDRHVGVLMKQMMETSDTPLRGHARHLGRTLGVLNKGGQLIQSRGWKFWKKKDDKDLADIKEDEDKDAMEELIKRKVSL